MIRLRHPRRDDPTIYSLIETELMPWSGISHPTDPRHKSEIRRKLSSGTTFVALNTRGKSIPPVGFVNTMIIGHMIYIDMLAVKADERQKGWGSQLMQTAELHGLRSGCTYAGLLVNNSNTAAFRYYMRRGYYPVKEHDELKCWEMHKPFYP